LESGLLSFNLFPILINFSQVSILTRKCWLQVWHQWFPYRLFYIEIHCLIYYQIGVVCMHKSYQRNLLQAQELLWYNEHEYPTFQWFFSFQGILNPTCMNVMPHKGTYCAESDSGIFRL
jgi:hypothetical protein